MLQWQHNNEEHMRKYNNFPALTTLTHTHTHTEDLALTVLASALMSCLFLSATARLGPALLNLFQLLL